MASTTSSWNDLDKRARAACTKEIGRLASKNRIKGVTGKVLGIGEDGDRYYALTVTGTEAGYAANWLCLYDKRTKKALARNIEKTK